MVQPTQTRLKASAYFQLPEYAAHDLIQLINGEVVIGMPPIPKHQRIVREVLVMLTLYARQHGGEALDSPIEVYLDEDNVYEPDVLYLAPASNSTVEEKRLIGAPELVVEVLSPSTAKYDRQEKYAAYEAHGVREYWIIDPLNETLEVWVLDDNKFQRLGAFGKADTLQSPLLNTPIAVKPLLDV